MSMPVVPVAGTRNLGYLKETVLLDEGTVTPYEDGENIFGNRQPMAVRSAVLHIGDLVELFDDSELVLSNIKGPEGFSEGITVVRALTAGARYWGRIVEIEKAVTQIPSQAVSSLADRISGGFLRPATVEFAGMIGRMVVNATIDQNTPADVIPVADPTKLVLDVSEKKFKFGTGTNTQLVPMTRLTGATGSAVTGQLLLGIGLQKLQVVE